MRGLLAFVFLTSAAPIHAKDVVIVGAGNLSCGDWVSDRSRSDRGTFISSWLGGYISAANAFGNGSGRAGAGSSFGDVQIWMDGYCRSNPFDKINTAAGVLLRELEGQQSR